MLYKILLGFGMGAATELLKGVIPAIKEWSQNRKITLRYFIDRRDNKSLLYIEKKEGDELAEKTHEVFRHMSEGYLDNMGIHGVNFTSYRFSHDFRDLDVKHTERTLKGVKLQKAPW